MSANKQLRNKIRNINDLMNEIDRIDMLKEEQQAYLANQYQLLKRKVEAPARFMNMLVSKVPGAGAIKGLVSMAQNTTQGKKSDWLTKAIQLVTPIVLNRTVLKNAGGLKKTVVNLASQAATSQINQSSVSNVVSGIANFIRPKKKRKIKKTAQLPGEITAEEAVEGNKYGIPKDSEAY